MRRPVWALLAGLACASPRTESPSVGAARAVLHRSEQAQKQRTGSLQVRCTPEDAEVWLDGARVGKCGELSKAPLRMGNGMHRVDVKKDGFLPYVTWYDPNETEGTQLGMVRASVTIRLQPLGAGTNAANEANAEGRPEGR